MSNVVIPLEADPHQFVLGLLPWYARGSLDADEAELVREHLQHCAGCRAELGVETLQHFVRPVDHRDIGAER